MNRKIPVSLLALLALALITTAASFSSMSSSTALYVLKSSGTATNLSVIGRHLSYSSTTNTTTTVLGYSMAVGQDAIAIGQNADTSGTQSAALGASSFARGNYSLALGTSAWATNDFSTAIGTLSAATNNYSVALGYNARTTATNQIRLGTTNETVSIPGALTVQGPVTFTGAFTNSGWARFTGGTEVYGGFQSYGPANGSTVIGQSASAAGNGGTAIGTLSTANPSLSTALGYGALAAGNFSVALGANASTTNDYSVALGYFAYPTTNNQIRLGTATETVSIPGPLQVEGAVTQSRGALAYTGGTNVLVNCALANDFYLTVTNNFTLIFTNIPATNRSYTFNLQARQNGTGGYTATLSATNCTGTNLTFSVVANALTLLSGVNSAFTNGQVVANALISQ